MLKWNEIQCYRHSYSSDAMRVCIYVNNLWLNEYHGDDCGGNEMSVNCKNIRVFPFFTLVISAKSCVTWRRRRKALVFLCTEIRILKKFLCERHTNTEDMKGRYRNCCFYDPLKWKLRMAEKVDVWNGNKCEDKRRILHLFSMTSHVFWWNISRQLVKKKLNEYVNTKYVW